MNTFETALTGGGLVTLVVEFIKWVTRRWIVKDTNFEFPPLFYVVAVPLLNALAPFALFWLGVATTDPILFMSFGEIGRYLLLVVFSSLLSLVGYNNGVKPTRTYVRDFAARKALAEVNPVELP